MHLLDFITPVKILTFFSFIVVLLFSDKSKKLHLYLLLITFFGAANEIASVVLKYYDLPVCYGTNLYIIINNFLWLVILRTVSRQKEPVLIVICFFITYTIITYAELQCFDKFNPHCFLAGSLLYVCIFIYDSFFELKRENLNYFLSTNYLLIFIPLLFFIGFSLIFGFKDKSIDKTIIFGTITLYKFVSYFVNVVYYLLITTYIFKERKRIL